MTPRSHAARPVLLVAIVLAVPAAAAHVPIFGEDVREVDATRSWAFYEELGPNEAHRWSFRVAQGDALLIQIAVPVGRSPVPDATLQGPSGAIALEREDAVELEPFTPYASRVVWRVEERAPAPGEHSLVVTGGPARYVLGVGEREAFTPSEWLGIPIGVLRIHAWEGQPWPFLALPYAIAFAAVALAKRSGRAPILPVALAAGLMAATTLERLLQIGRALVAGARPGAAALAVAVGIALLGAVMGFATWRARRPWVLVACGVAALATWSGMIAGGLLAILAGLLAARRDLQRGRSRAKITALRR